MGWLEYDHILLGAKGPFSGTFAVRFREGKAAKVKLSFFETCDMKMVGKKQTYFQKNLILHADLPW